MIKHSLDTQNPLGQITLSAKKHNRVERNTGTGQMFLVRGGKAVQDCLLYPGWKLILVGSLLTSALFPEDWRLPGSETCGYPNPNHWFLLPSVGMGTWCPKFGLILTQLFSKLGAAACRCWCRGQNQLLLTNTLMSRAL